MFEFRASDIAKACEGELILGSQDALANSCYINSQDSVKDSMFAAFAGERADGHDYLESAAKKGARVFLISDGSRDFSFLDSETCAVILVSDVLLALQKLANYQRSLMSCPVIGITGSSGKTSTKELLKGALQANFDVTASEGSYNNELGVPLTILRANKDTQVLVLEMGMRGLGQITELTDIAHPTMSIITTIGDAHIEMLGSRENIAKAKGEIFEALTKDQLAFMPADVDYGDYLRSICKATLITSYVENHVAQHLAVVEPATSELYKTFAGYTADITSYDPEGNASALVKLPNGDVHNMKLEIPGEHSISNALLALAAAQMLGIDAQAAIRGMEAVRPAEMRMQRCEVNNLPGISDVSILVDCYNANPESTEAALKTLSVSELGDPRTGLRIAVLGDMLEMGQHCAKVHKDILLLAGMLKIDLVYTFGKAYAGATKDVLKELSTGRSLEDIPEIRSFTDMNILISSLSAAVTTGSLILVKGSRGMQMERVVKALNIDEDEKSTEGGRPW